jgi:uncharacterized membrane protein (GlpM family)
VLVKVKLAALAGGRWYEYAVRFVLGGAMTALAGWIAKEWGPAVGGLFLAFPAIFPASATLLEKHQREKKEKAGLPGGRRGRDAAALEATGAVLGSIGLMVFGTIVWQVAPASAGIALGGSAVVWLVVAVALWAARRHVRLTRRAI